MPHKTIAPRQSGWFKIATIIAIISVNHKHTIPGTRRSRAFSGEFFNNYELKIHKNSQIKLFAT